MKRLKTGDDPATIIPETPATAIHQVINSTESSCVTLLDLCTTTSTQLSTAPHLNTSSILENTSNSQLSTVTPSVSLSVFRRSSRSLNILPSSLLPPISNQATIISSTPGTKAARPFLSSTCPQPPLIKATGNPKNRCNTVYTCQTTKPTAHVQTDDDILEYIKIYLSPFLTSEKNEAFDSTVFDELFHINSISEKLDNFDNLDVVQRLPLC